MAGDQAQRAVLAPAAEGNRLRIRARQLAWATVAWNVVEALVAITAGAAAGSTATAKRRTAWNGDTCCD